MHGTGQKPFPNPCILPCFYLHRRSRRHDIGSAAFNPGLFHESTYSSHENGASQPASDNHQTANGDVGINDAGQNAVNVDLNAPEKMLIVWGTNIIVKDVVAAFRDFLENFTLAHLPSVDGASAQAEPLANRFEPFYPRLLSYLHAIESR